MSATRFAIRVEDRYSLLLRLFGVRPTNAHVDLDGDLDATFGRFSVQTPVANVTRWRIAGMGYRVEHVKKQDYLALPED